MRAFVCICVRVCDVAYIFKELNIVVSTQCKIFSNSLLVRDTGAFDCLFVAFNVFI